MASVLVPVLYLVAIFGGLFVFGRFYMGKHAGKSTEPYFPRHIDRDVYVSLLALSPPAPDALLKSALLRRAMADVHRIIRIRDDKPALQQLLQKGLVGEDLWTSLLAAEKELETEILDVQAEANSFVEGWGGIIFASAGELVNNEKVIDVFRGVPKMKAELEAKYNRKVKGINLSALPPGMQVRPSTPVPSNAATASATSSRAQSSAPSTPGPITPAPAARTLAPESDVDSPTSPKSPSKKSKKRK